MPKTELDGLPVIDAEKKPEGWVTGDEPMTDAQASYLQTLSEQADQPYLYDESLTKAEASERIDELKVFLSAAEGVRLAH